MGKVSTNTARSGGVGYTRLQETDSHLDQTPAPHQRGTTSAPRRSYLFQTMKLAALAVAGLMTLGTLPAQAHHEHRRDGDAVPYVLGGAILGGLLYYGTRDHDHGHYHYHRRHRRARVIDEYRYRGHNYRVCRRGNDVFYC